MSSFELLGIGFLFGYAAHQAVGLVHAWRRGRRSIAVLDRKWDDLKELEMDVTRNENVLGKARPTTKSH